MEHITITGEKQLQGKLEGSYIPGYNNLHHRHLVKTPNSNHPINKQANQAIVKRRIYQKENKIVDGQPPDSSFLRAERVPEQGHENPCNHIRNCACANGFPV
jgi:hypothetical protein